MAAAAEAAVSTNLAVACPVVLGDGEAHRKGFRGASRSNDKRMRKVKVKVEVEVEMKRGFQMQHSPASGLWDCISWLRLCCCRLISWCWGWGFLCVGGWFCMRGAGLALGYRWDIEMITDRLRISLRALLLLHATLFDGLRRDAMLR